MATIDKIDLEEIIRINGWQKKMSDFDVSVLKSLISNLLLSERQRLIEETEGKINEMERRLIVKGSDTMSDVYIGKLNAFSEVKAILEKMKGCQ